MGGDDSEEILTLDTAGLAAVLVGEGPHESSSPAPASLSLAPGPPARLGDYEPLAEIGRGGMGAVYLCRRAGEAGFERLFAVKVMHPHLVHEPGFVQMLLDEARLAAGIHHRNVVAILDLGIDRECGCYYVAMDYVEGCSLAQLLGHHRRWRPPALLSRIAVGALHGLHAAHTAVDADGAPLQLVHRDVSPQNILLGVDGEARIIDFGIAKATARIASTQPGYVKGKLSYTAPEALLGESPDRRADLFAVGAVLWSALTGRALFRGDTDAETVRNLLRCEVPAPSQIGLKPPAWLDEPIVRALARDPAARFDSAADMAAAIRDAAVSAGEFGSSEEVARWVQEAFAHPLAERRDRIRGARRRRATGHPPGDRSIVPPLAEPATAIVPTSLVADLRAAIASLSDRELQLVRRALPDWRWVAGTALLAAAAAALGGIAARLLL